MNREHRSIQNEPTASPQNYLEVKLIKKSPQEAILENILNGEKISWPIAQLPNTLNEGDICAIKLINPNEEDNGEIEKRRKLLEELMN